MRAWSVVLSGVVAVAACRSGTVDTTKDVYDDSEAPEVQIYKLNGEERKIPWKDVREGERWLYKIDNDNPLPGIRYKYHVPIVRIEVWAHDKEGNPVDPRRGDVWDGRFTEYGLNPKYVRTGILGERH